MALTRRGLTVSVIVGVVLVGAIVGVILLTGGKAGWIPGEQGPLRVGQILAAP